MRLDLSGRCTDRINTLHPLPEQVVQHRVVAALVLAPENEVDVCRKGFERLNGGIDIGRLGIVVIVHAANRRYVLQSVLDRFEVANRIANPVRLTPQENSDADRGQDIFNIVCALQRNFGNQHDLFLAMGIAEEDTAVVDKSALLYFPSPAEPENLCPGAGCQFNTGQVIGVEHSKVFRPLIFEDARLGVSVCGERAMPVEMVGRDVEDYGNLGTECLNGLKLET